MTDYYQDMRDACARIVKDAADRSDLIGANLHDLLEMAKWVAMDRDDAMAACKEAMEKAMEKGVENALFKSIEQELAR